MGMIIASLWGLKLKAQHMWRNMKKNNEISGLEEERNLLRKKVEHRCQQLIRPNSKRPSNRFAVSGWTKS
jgi:hypothetical protein